MSTATATLSTRQVAHGVRLVATSVLVGLLVALGALEPPEATSTGASEASPDPSAIATVALERATDRQSAVGRHCGAEPRLTDVVLFQFSHSDEITVLSFGQAVQETAARTGWVRSYCV